MTPLSILSWLAFSKVGRIVLISLASLIGYLGFSQYYKYEGRKQVYEKIEVDTKKARETREKIDNSTSSRTDSDIDRWLRGRAEAGE